MDIYRAHVLCCGGTGCTSSGSAQIIERFEQKMQRSRPGKGSQGCPHGLLRPVRRLAPLLSYTPKAPSTPA